MTSPTRPSDTAITLRAHAKLTLGLRITGVRADGYHLIDAEMVSLDLHDVVTVTPGSSGLTACLLYTSDAADDLA